MSLLSIFKKQTINHDKFGQLSYGFGKWKGKSAKLLQHEAVILIIPGDKTGPSAVAIKQLEQLEQNYSDMMEKLASTLYEEHYMAGKEAFDSGELEGLVEDYPTIDSPADIWPFVKVARVWVDAYGKHGQIEVAFLVDWDEEHSLGFTFEDCKVVDFCGSVGV